MSKCGKDLCLVQEKRLEVCDLLGKCISNTSPMDLETIQNKKHVRTLQVKFIQDEHKRLCTLEFMLMNK